MVVAGSLIGMSLPFLLKRFQLDPATASAPLVTTTYRQMGNVCVFLIAWLTYYVLEPTISLYEHDMIEESTLLEIFRLLEQMGKEVAEFVKEETVSSANGKTLPEDLRVHGYGELYELPIQQIAAYLFKEANLWDQLVEVGKSSNPNVALLKIAQADLSEYSINSENAFVVGIALMVLFVNLQAIAYYNFSMPELIAQVQRGNDLALFQAVRLDPSVLQTQAAGDRVSKASLCADCSFFHSLSLAITKTKPAIPMAHLHETRILMHILENAGALEELTDARLTDLAVNKLGIYPNGVDPLSAIRDQRRKRSKAKRGLVPHTGPLKCHKCIAHVESAMGDLRHGQSPFRLPPGRRSRGRRLRLGAWRRGCAT